MDSSEQTKDETMTKYLRVGYSHYIDEDNVTEYGITGKLSRKVAIEAAQKRASELECTINKSPDWDVDYLLFTLYLHFDISSYPDDWSASDFALGFNFTEDNPIPDDDTQIKSVKIVEELPAGCRLGEIEVYEAE